MMSANIRIVLVETSHPGNIGGAARAMKNMCLSQLYLVRPKQFPAADATARASGADDLLANAVVCDSLEQALVDCQLVVGSSARLRSVSWPQLDPRECGELISKRAQAAEVALVFGREHAGLTNAELDLCQYLVNIPTNTEFQSLNLAAAVQVLSYEIYMHSKGKTAELALDDEPLASSQDMEKFYQHLETALLEIGFFKPPNYKKLLRRLRRLYHRAQPNITELNILRGMLSAAQGKKYTWMKKHTDLSDNSGDPIL